MQRKLIQHGLSSLTVSLPHDFVKRNSLTKGQTIEVEQLPDGLLLRPSASKQKIHAEVDLSGKIESAKKILGAFYKCNFTHVEIHFEDAGELERIQQILGTQFASYAITRQTKSTIVVEPMYDDDYTKLDAAMQRMFHIVKSMSHDALLAREKDDWQWLKTIALMKFELDKLADFSRKAANSGAMIGIERIGPFYTLVEQTEKIADTYQQLCEYVSTTRRPCTKSVVDAYSMTEKYIRMLYETFARFDIERMHAFIQERRVIESSLDRMGLTKEVMYVYRIIAIAGDLNGPIMAIRLKQS